MSVCVCGNAQRSVYYLVPESEPGMTPPLGLDVNTTHFLHPTPLIPSHNALPDIPPLYENTKTHTHTHLHTHTHAECFPVMCVAVPACLLVSSDAVISKHTSDRLWFDSITSFCGLLPKQLH